MSAPYQLPADLKTQPLGISWSTLGGLTSLNATAAEQQTAIENIARQASSEADGEAGQPLRAALHTETNYAPGHRCGVLANGLGRFIASRNPILSVAQAQVAPANQLPNTTWVQMPVGTAYPEEEPLGIYNSTAPGGAHGGGQGILLSGCYVNWGLGRLGTRVQVSYLAGWPHTQLMVDADKGTSSLEVDDVSAWGGAVGLISDGGQSEIVQCGVAVAAPAPAYNPVVNYLPGTIVSYGGANYGCLVVNGPGTTNGAITPGTSSAYWAPNPVPVGPGTLSLLSPTQNPHSAPVLVTSTPASLRWAVALFAKAEALERGVATMSIGSEENSSGGVGGAIASAKREGAIIIRDLVRVY